jgi:hypothetical protein
LLLVWPHIQPQIARGIARGAGDTISERGLFIGVVDGTLDLWVMNRGSEILAGIFLRIDQRARGKALVVLDVVAGNGHHVGVFSEYARDIVPRLREYGQMIGAYTIESVSRPGAARLLSRLGCTPKAIIMELNDGRRHT